jgi:inner membrane protein
MTTFEHAMLGTTGALAVGLQRRSWQIVAWAGIASVLPDWDGLSILFGAAAFDRIHRAVGHSLFVATGVAIVLAVVEYRLRLLSRCGVLLARRVEGIPLQSLPEEGAASTSREGIVLWAVVAMVATWSHLAADLLFSGHAQLSEWGLQLFWPISQTAYVFPAVRWGDPLPTIILVAGMFAMLRWRSRVQGLAALTLVALVGYIALRASFMPY